MLCVSREGSSQAGLDAPESAMSGYRSSLDPLICPRSGMASPKPVRAGVAIEAFGATSWTCRPTTRPSRTTRPIRQQEFYVALARLRSGRRRRRAGRARRRPPHLRGRRHAPRPGQRIGRAAGPHRPSSRSLAGEKPMAVDTRLAQKQLAQLLCGAGGNGDPEYTSLRDVPIETIHARAASCGGPRLPCSRSRSQESSGPDRRSSFGRTGARDHDPRRPDDGRRGGRDRSGLRVSPPPNRGLPVVSDATVRHDHHSRRDSSLASDRRWRLEAERLLGERVLGVDLIAGVHAGVAERRVHVRRDRG